MAARAVVVGSETYGLTGCDADVELIAALLAQRGFDVTRLTGGDARRADILAALDDLVAATGPGDAALMYYSGHGGRLARPDADQRKAEGRSGFFQFLVPTDMQESKPGDFRGVLSEELSSVHRRLSDKFAGQPPNVTTILDCCHSGYMARNLTARSRAVNLTGSKMFTVQGILEHVQSLGPDADVAIGETTNDVVRMVACQVEQSAFELPSERGSTHGVFTDELVGVLDQVGDARVSWRMVGELVRRRVRGVVPEQRPEVEGPGDRQVFDTALVAATTSLPLVELDGSLAIPSAALFGVGRGDEILLTVLGSDTAEHQATVADVRGGAAVIDLPKDVLGDDLSSVVATPIRISAPQIGVEVGEGPSREEIVTAVEASNSLTTKGARPLVRLRSTGEQWCVDDAQGEQWRSATVTPDEGGVAQLVDEIESIATGHRLLDLPGGTGEQALGDDVDIRFCRIENGKRIDLGRHGERIKAGTPITLTVTNRSKDVRFVWVFDVGVSGRSSLVTGAAPSGTRLGPAGDEDDSADIWGEDGTALYWPDDVPTDEHGRSEVFVVITADDRQDLSALARGAALERGSKPRSALDLLLDEARIGSREVATAKVTGGGLRYRLDRIEFVNVP